MWDANPITDGDRNSLTNDETTLCSASYVSWQRGTTRICCCAPCCDVAAAGRRPCSNRSISLSRRAHSSKPATAACDEPNAGKMDKRTDIQTDARPLHRPCSAYWAEAVSTNNRFRSLNDAVSRCPGELDIKQKLSCGAIFYASDRTS